MEAMGPCGRWFVTVAFSLASAQAIDCRLTLVDQSDWNRQRGFYLNLENSSASGPCQLSTLKIALGVADGSQWRFVVQTIGWRLDTDYTATVVIGNGAAELKLNGVSMGRIAGGLYQVPGSISAGGVPSWASGAATYIAAETSFTLASTTGLSLTMPFADATRPPALMAIAPGSPQSGVWNSDAGTWTLTVTFRLVNNVALSGAPLFDRYLQGIDATWPGKIAGDADLTSATAAEDARLADWGVPSGVDGYGGVLNSGWNEPGTGYFRVIKKNGRWWLITPLGNPVFYIGIDTAPALNWDCTPTTGRDGLFAELPSTTDSYGSETWKMAAWGDSGVRYACFNTVNMIRKYGSGWKQEETNRTIRRSKAWGFSGLGKWADQIGDLPIMPVLSRGSTQIISRHPDVFDSSVQTLFRNDLARQITPRVQDPRVVGWSLGNEYDEIISAAETTDILGKTGIVSAKRAFVDEALRGLYGGNVQSLAAAWGLNGVSSVQDLYNRTPSAPASDVEYLRRYYARTYYNFVYSTVKSIDPNHLYLGFWIVPGWWENEEDWRLITPYCDVIGYDRYSDDFVDDALDGLMRESAKPVLAGEFSFPATYDLMRGFRVYGTSARDDAESGMKYAQWVRDASRNPYCVGLGWFQYRDEPLSGRGPGSGPDPVYGEDYAFGLVDVGDRPKWDLVEAVRRANLDAAQTRLSAPLTSVAAVVNAATFAPGAPVAPGSIISLFGTGLDGATFWMNGNKVSVLYPSSGQVNAQAPWALAGQSSAVLSTGGADPITVPLAVYSPGIFASIPTGEYVVLYANGLGPLNSDSTTTGKPSVTVGNVAAEVTYSGLAPGWIGLYQVNARYGLGTPSGAQPVLLSIGGLTSNTGSVVVR